MNAPILEVQNVTMRFGGIVANRGVNFSVAKGGITALIGPNGAGKTTMFNCITGFYRASEGRIVLNGPEGPRDIGAYMDKPITGGSHQVTRAGIARTFQNIRLFKEMSVVENLLVAQHLATRNGLLSGIFKTSAFRKAETEAVDRAYYWLGQMNLLEDANRLAGELPYGRQRRLEIARAMCTGPQLICLDEPAAGLNPSETHELSQIIQRLCAEQELTVLVIEHDMGLVMRISNHIVVLDHGEVIADGTPEQVANDPAVIAAYLGVSEEEVQS
ncbi:ABC transporter ATP-binding protein [Brucella haematophila]|jgi:branched-chain amino acid transport system ATP-binding protein|uniref:ATP-binding cassette domain-containing protein n=1 Tax=Brucella haematophila TaxID=419474 RepID=A0ABX1DM28_9HYPH|nr:ATP-binding cassette domain-containing protein [Brucella haematophila]KAB2699967.1 ATP-binding cassette domain-containing protein [Ochrobactrum sp. Kaboul]NKC04026.1 ATP-binding cassette domain-containing protein [Brucella haematophila]TMV05791.1 ATP-binding cassette domain-containing protein [Brucella haematophila]